MLLILSVLFFLVVFLCAVIFLFKLFKGTTYGLPVQTWLLVFAAEILVLFCVPKGIHLFGLTGVFLHGGYYYLISFTAGLAETIAGVILGKRPEELKLLLVPLVPAIIVLLFTFRRPSPPAN